MIDIPFCVFLRVFFTFERFFFGVVFVFCWTFVGLFGLFSDLLQNVGFKKTFSRLLSPIQASVHCIGDEMMMIFMAILVMSRALASVGHF
jgi:hypothetical protein